MWPGFESQDLSSANGSIPSDPEALRESPAYWDKDDRLITRLNEPFWAAFYARQEKALIFEGNEAQLYAYDEKTGLFRPKSTDAIRKELAELIFRC